MIARVAVLSLALVLAGCGDVPGNQRDAWETAPQEYVCTVEQMKRVETETRTCIADTSLFSSYCYGTAFMRDCTKRPSSGGAAP